jgi:D-amino peptidase
MGIRHRTALLASCCLALHLGLPSSARAFKVYVSTDMEGCSGITCSEQVAAEEGKQLMAGDMNACIEGCFAAGATEVVVRDCHGGGSNVNPRVIDRRAKLIQGSTPGKRFKDIEGSAAIILLGYHAKALTPGGTLAHSYSSASIQGMWLNGRSVGEIGVDAVIAAEYKVPVVMVSGDDKTCAEAKSWIPGVVTCQTKKGTGSQSAELLPVEESRRLITQKTKEALAKRNEIRAAKIDRPATIRWDYLPKGSLRTHNPSFKPVDDPRRVEKTGDSVEALLLGKATPSATSKDEKEAQDTAKVTGTFLLPKELDSFDGRVVEIRLYKIHLMIADKAADLVEKVEIKDFAHTKGTETKKAFVVGAKAKLEKDMKYYLTLFILNDGQRTHMGEVSPGAEPPKVLTQGHPNKVTLTVRQVR